MCGLKSRRKGCNGEREVVHFFRDAGIPAERDGRISKHDVVLPLAGWRLEVKRLRSIKTVQGWMDQARAFCGPHRPAVMVRQDGSSWLVVMDANDFLRLIE